MAAGQPRPSNKRLANESSANEHSANEHSANEHSAYKRSDWNDALGQGEGEFILLASPWALPAADLLEHTIAWLVAQPELSYLYSADHEFAPRQFAGLVPGLGADRTAGCSLLRRAAWQEARSQSDYDPARPTRGLRSGSALLLPDASRLRIDRAESESGSLSDDPVAAVAAPVIIERADSRAIMCLKRALIHLQTLLRFYSPVPRAMFLLLPAIALIGDMQLIDFRADVALAFAFPHLALLTMIHDRGDPIRRWGSLRAVRELLLAMMVPTLTAAAFVRASLSDPRLFLRRSFGRPRVEQPLSRSLLCYALVVLNGAALCHGIVEVFARGAMQGSGPRSAQLIFCALAAANLVLLLARQAMVHEARHIVSYLQGKAHLSATLIFASGHTLSCRTNNFPNQALELELPRELTTLDLGPWNLQIRYDDRPVCVLVHATDVRGRRIVVRIAEQSEADYLSLRDQVLARDWNWPVWLAHKEADRILPPWLHDRLVKLPVWFIDASTKLAGALRVDQLYLLFKK
jgi:hypothetical protein